MLDEMVTQLHDNYSQLIEQISQAKILVKAWFIFYFYKLQNFNDLLQNCKFYMSKAKSLKIASTQCQQISKHLTVLEVHTNERQSTQVPQGQPLNMEYHRNNNQKPNLLVTHWIPPKVHGANIDLQTPYLTRF